MLGGACLHLGDHDEGRAHLEKALELAESSGDVLGQAQARFQLAKTALLGAGADDQALDHALGSLRLFETLGMRPQQVTMLNMAAVLEVRLGLLAAARAHCESAVTINRTLDPADRSGDAGLEPLGDIAASDGDHVSALKYYRLAAETLVADGFSYGVAGTYERIGRSERALGRVTEARVTWSRTLELYAAQHRLADAERVRALLAEPDENADGPPGTSPDGPSVTAD